MGKPAQRRLDAANDDRQAGKSPPGQAGINDDRPVRAAACHAAGGVGVFLAPPPGHGIVGDHGIDIAGVDQNAEARPAHGLKISG